MEVLYRFSLMMAALLSFATAGVLLLRTILNLQVPEPRFEAQVIDDEIAIGYGLAIGDVDGDGRPDILLADKEQFVWYRNGDWQRFVMAENLTERDGWRWPPRHHRRRPGDT